jgi:hypothetical protein
MSYRNLLAALVAVALTGCLMPVQSPADGVPRYPDGTLSDGGTVQNDGGGQYEPVLTRVELNQPTNGAHYYPGVTFFLQATAYDQKESILNSGTTFQWSTSGAGSLNIADTSTPYIQVSGATQGDVNITITATRGSVVKSASISITIDAPPLALGSIEVPTAPTTLQTNESKTAAFVAKDTNGAVVDQAEVDFDSIDSDARATLTVNRDIGGVAFHAQPNGGKANWTLVAHRRGTATTVSTGGSVTVTVPTVNRIVVGTVSQPTNASACAPTQWGVQPTTSGTLTAVAVGGECAPYAGQLDWSVSPAGVVNVTGSGATASWNAVSDGHATVTAKSKGDNGAAFTASLEVTSSYPVVMQVDGSCTMSNQSPISLTTGQSKTLKLAKYKGPGNCDSSDTSVSWSNNNPAAASLSATGSTATLTANSSGGGAISATLNTYGTGTSIEYTVASAPAPIFNSGSFDVTWSSAKKFSFAWPTATIQGGGTVTYKLSGTSAASGGKFAEQTVNGTSTDIDVSVPAADWIFTLKACNGATTSCATLTSATYVAAAPTQAFFTVLGSDRGVYRVALDGSSSALLGTPGRAPSAGLTTTPRPDAQGNLYGIASGSGKTMQVQKAATSTFAEFTAQSQVDLGFSNASCANLGLNLTAFPIEDGQLAFVSGASLLSCGRGQLVVTSMTNNSSQSLVATDVSSSAVAGATLGKLAYIFRGGLYVVESTSATTAAPLQLSTSVTGQLLGSNNGFYTLSAGTLLYFDTASSGQTGDAVSFTGDFSVADIDATQFAYGLPTGELIFAIKAASGGGFGVATPSNATTFSTKKVAAPSVTGVTFTLGTSSLQ